MDATDGQNWKRLKRIKIRVFENYSAQQFFHSWSLLLATSKNNARETYLFVWDLWFCHLHVISLLTLRSIAIEGE